MSAGPFNLPKAGRYNVEITSYFNGPWQQPSDVIAIVGSDGKNLPVHLLVPEDAEFPSRGGHLDFQGSVTVPPLVGDLDATST
jgi:hypothetical protein